MSARAPTLFTIALVGVALVGCAGPQQPNYVSSRQLSVAEPSDQADQLWEVVQETLHRHCFQLDRVDRRAGAITTLPEVSKHFFETWRHDVETRHDFWEATLNPIRRRVEVTFSHDDGQSWEKLSVAVNKERLSSPDRQFNSTGAAYQYFGDSLPSTTGLIRVTKEHDRWLHLGRDPAMEDYLLRAMLSRAGIEVQ